MIDLKTENGIAIVTIGHGKANALDVELCDAIANTSTTFDRPTRARWS